MKTLLEIVGGITVAAVVLALGVRWLLSGLKPGDMP